MSAPGAGEELDPVLWRADHASPARPVILAGFRGFGVASGDGELRWARETRGAEFDWGGVYADGVRLTGPWTLSIGLGTEEFELPGTLASLTVRRSRLESLHRAAAFELLQSICVPSGTPGVARRLEFRSRSGEDLLLRLRSEQAPSLAPVLVEGLRPLEYRAVDNHRDLRVHAVGSAVRFEADRSPGAIEIDGRPWTGGTYRGPIERIVHDYSVVLPARARAVVHLLVSGGAHEPAPEEPPGPATSFDLAEHWRTGCEAWWAAWTGGTPELSFPDDPELERGYRLARGALRSLYCDSADEIRGLRAGYPWYATIWGRDLAWMLPAVLWMNDAAWAADSLRTIFRYQAPNDVPLLAGLAGELPMQLAPGPVFLYGSSDTTLYYPGLAARLVGHTGYSEAIASELGPGLAQIGGYLARRTDPGTGLVLNGGELGSLQSAAQGAGRVALGIAAEDTTIWDSTDRRDHAVEVQVLAVEALRALARSSEARGIASEAAALSARADRLAGALLRQYRWTSEGYLFDTIRQGLGPVGKVRPNALLAVSAGLVSGTEAAAAVRRAAEPDLTTPWGVRTLSDRDPTYDPKAYHDGQVWPIATAWAARAALSVGRTELAREYLTVLARSFAAEGGLANECYRGDSAAPWDSCCLLGLSVGPFLSSLFEGLWGLRPELDRDTLSIEPRFPEGWRRARLEGLKLGDGLVSVDWEEGRMTVRWTGSGPLRLLSPAGETLLAPYSATRL